MKYKIIYSALLFFLSLTLVNRGQAQTWNTLIGNNLNGTQWLGSNGSSTSPLELKTIETGGNALPINFYTSNTQRMTLSSGGSLGIGLTTPSRRLDVLAAGNPQLRLTQTAGADFTDFQTTNGNGLQVYQTDGLVSLFNTGASPSHIKLAIGTQASTANTWNLTVHSDDRVSVVTQYTNFNTGANLTSGFVTGVVSTGDAVIQHNESGKYIGFNTNSGTGTTQRMIITPDGKVGIGTSTPGAILNLFSSSNPQLLISNTSSIQTTIRVAGTGHLLIRPLNGANGRNVGIQDASANSPLYKLHVFGTIGVRDMNAVGVTGTLFPVAWDDGSNQLIKSTPAPYGILSYCSAFNPSTDRNYLIKWSSGSSAEICKSIVFDDGTNVGINGNGVPPFWGARLSVNNGPNNIAVYGVSHGIGWKTEAGYFEAYDSPGNLYGIESWVHGTSSSNSAGISVFSDVTTQAENFGILVSTIGNGGIDNTGISAYASNSILNYGVIGTAGQSADGNLNYGLCGIVQGTNTMNYAGYFSGDIGTTAGFYAASDSKLKENIQPLTGLSSLKIIDALQPKTYTFRTHDYPYMSLPGSKQFGFISEEVQQILPMLVKDSKSPPKMDTLGNIIYPSVEFKALNYTAFIPILIAAVKQLDSVNNSLQQQLTQLQNCCSQNNGQTLPGGRVQQSVELSNAIVLDQNSPNPFAEQTIITYTIPESVTEAKIIFYTVTGSVLKTVTITSKGEGALTVYASNLSSGIYLYSLVADGQTIDTKKMTKMR